MMEEKLDKQIKRNNIIIALLIVVLIIVIIVLYFLLSSEKKNSSTYDEYSEYSSNYVETFKPIISEVNSKVELYWFESVDSQDIDFIVESVTKINPKVKELYYISFDETLRVYTVEDNEDNEYLIPLED